MNIQVKTDVTITIDSSQDAVEKIREWIDNANLNEYNISLVVADKQVILAEIFSERVQSLEFQMENLMWQNEQFRNFCKIVPEVVEYSSSIMTELI
jgi:hypothetical protein